METNEWFEAFSKELASLVKIIHRAFRNEGFDREEAFALTKEYMRIACGSAADIANDIAAKQKREERMQKLREALKNKNEAEGK